ncbi:pyridoxamine 5'-phosphate oxidase [Celeribacter indicus]|uniref:Pyridoxine/pyridoxamine 5'-phosphate oxidase n=1 Tax=Celeribacter indicus TaxID=1208324 RepID=A0A0B5E3S6_9RHOB|nr:pyridoxamine 5'-phosphate oxidase [Celeribacter indicus]AJE47706.1 pyridoxamine 5'-phosphate oxidase [Celeribacter indicus]SDW14804.1 Pyridoxamine 5'-phosphate oxidase [Celeribacter indicus]
MGPRRGIFAGENPFEIARRWLAEAEAAEPNDPNAIALATVDPEGLPNVRMVLLKEIAPDAFVFFTNYESAKGEEIEASGKAAFVMHWKSLRRQVRVRGTVLRESADRSDAYYGSRALGSRIGAWASRQSRPLSSKAALMEAVTREGLKRGTHPERPPFWGGYRIVPVEIEFWADGEFRLHDRFRWRRADPEAGWDVQRLSP